MKKANGSLIQTGMDCPLEFARRFGVLREASPPFVPQSVWISIGKSVTYVLNQIRYLCPDCSPKP